MNRFDFDVLADRHCFCCCLDTGPVHGKSRLVYETEKARLHGAATDEGGRQGGEAEEAGATEQAGQGEATSRGGGT